MLGLESRLKTPRVLLSLVAVSSLLQAGYFVADTPHSAAHLATVVLNLLVAGFAIGYLRTRDWQFVWVGLAGAALEVIPLAIHWQRGSITVSLRLLLCAAVIVHLALLALIVLLGSRRLSPRTACLASLLPAFLLFSVEVLLEGRARQQPSLFLTIEQEHAANPLATLAWPETLCADHAIWGSSAKPNRFLRQFVSADDRGHLLPAGYYGRIPPKSFRLVKATGVNASVAFPTDTPPRVRTEIVQPGTEAWQLQLNSGPHPIQAHARYSLRFRARSTASPRPLLVAFAQLHEPWINLGLLQTFDLSETWQTFQAGFIATQSDAVAGLLFQGGGNASGWEFADCRLELVSPPGALPHDLRAWEPFTEPGNTALVTLNEDVPERLLLRVPEAPSHSAASATSRGRAVCRGVHVTRGQRYELRLVARSDPPTTVNLIVTQNHAPWGPLGLHHPVPLSGTLREHRLTFTARETDDDGLLGIELPAHCQVELQASELRSVSSASTASPSPANPWNWQSLPQAPPVKTEIRQAPGVAARLLWRFAQEGLNNAQDPPGWFVHAAAHPAAPHYLARLLARSDQPARLRINLIADPTHATVDGSQLLDLTSTWSWHFLDLQASDHAPRYLALQPAAPVLGVEVAALDVVPYGQPPHQSLYSPYSFAVPYELNSQGFRDQEHPPRTPEGVIRLALFGDSVAFGIGVPPEARFGELLEQQSSASAASSSHARLEVLHCATPGWGIRQLRSAFQEFCARYSVKLAILALTPNDDTSYAEELSPDYRRPFDAYRPIFRLFDLLPNAQVPTRPGADRLVEELDAMTALATQRGIALAIVWIDPHPTPSSRALSAALQQHAQKAQLAWLAWPGEKRPPNQPIPDRELTIEEQPLTREEHRRLAEALAPFVSSQISAAH